MNDIDARESIFKLICLGNFEKKVSSIKNGEVINLKWKLLTANDTEGCITFWQENRSEVV